MHQAPDTSSDIFAVSWARCWYSREEPDPVLRNSKVRLNEAKPSDAGIGKNACVRSCCARTSGLDMHSVHRS